MEQPAAEPTGVGPLVETVDWWRFAALWPAVGRASRALHPHKLFRVAAVACWWRAAVAAAVDGDGGPAEAARV